MDSIKDALIEKLVPVVCELAQRNFLARGRMRSIAGRRKELRWNFFWQFREKLFP